MPCVTSCKFTIREGDTWETIAAIYNLTPRKLQKLNPKRAPDAPLPAGKVRPW